MKHDVTEACPHSYTMSGDGSGVQSEVDLSRSSKEVADLELQESKVSKRNEDMAQIIFTCNSQASMSPEHNIELELKAPTQSEDTPVLQETPTSSQENRETATGEVEGSASQACYRSMVLPQGNSPRLQINRSMSEINRSIQDGNRLMSEVTHVVSHVRSHLLLKSNSKAGKINYSLSKNGKLFAVMSESFNTARPQSFNVTSKKASNTTNLQSYNAIILRFHRYPVLHC